MEYKTAIVGSRKFNDYEFMKRILDPIKDKIGMIISGGAVGTDTLAQRYAKDNGIVIVIYYPNYAKYGKKAPFVRNVVIANAAEKMIAFAYSDSKGTRHAISKMEQLHKPVVIIELEGTVI